MAEQDIEIRFTNDNNVKKLKEFVNTHFNASQLENMIAALYMYVEIAANEEMSNRIYTNNSDLMTEARLRGVAKCASDFKNFLKFPGQNN